MPGYIGSTYTPSLNNKPPKRVLFNDKLAKSLGLNQAQKELVKFLCKENSRCYGPYDDLLFLASIYGHPWEVLVALASRSGVRSPEDLYIHLKRFKIVIPLRDKLPWRMTIKPYYPYMCGGKTPSGPCRNLRMRKCCSTRNLIQLIKVNGDTRKSWLLPYYVELPINGSFSLKDSVLKNAIAVDAMGFKIDLSEHDQILCQDGVYFILTSINGNTIKWPAKSSPYRLFGPEMGIINFAFRTKTRLSWTDVNWSDNAYTVIGGMEK